MLKIGLTGGIGSGKTTVAHIFSLLGVPVYPADLRARFLLENHGEIRKQVIALLGSDVYLASGEPDRALIAQHVFSDPVLLQSLNAIIHPVVREDFQNWCREHATHPLVLQEAAILFESGAASAMDANILVWAPEALRIERVIHRDGVTGEQVRARMRHQMADTEKIPGAQFVVINDGDHGLIRQVREIYQVLRYLSRTGSGPQS